MSSVNLILIFPSQFYLCSHITFLAGISVEIISSPASSHSWPYLSPTPHLAATLGSGPRPPLVYLPRPTGTIPPLQRRHVAPETPLHLLLLCLPSAPRDLEVQPHHIHPCTCKDQPQGGHTASVHLTTQGKRMNVCLILFLKFIQQISQKAECFCWYLMTQTPFSLEVCACSVVPASFQPNGL